MTRYRDIQGNAHTRPSREPVEWRIGGYAVVEQDGCLLMVETVLPSRWRWDLPGGGILLDPEETILEGIVREVREETGFVIEPCAESLTLVDDAFLCPPSGRFWHVLTFAAMGTVVAEPDDDWTAPDDEIATVAWVDAGSLQREEMIGPQWNLLVRLGFVGGNDP